MKAVIFDMDGVISDTQHIYSAAESKVMEEYGIYVDPEEMARRFSGVSDVDQFGQLFREVGQSMPPIEEIVQKRNALMAGAHIKVVPGASEIIKMLHDRMIPMAVASGSALDYIDFVLEELALRPLFSAIASGNEVANGKPAPDVFLLAAKRLRVAPSDCVVIEDGLHGMMGAKAAGMFCVGLLTHVTENESPADVNVHNLTDLTLEILGISAPEKM